MSTQSTTSFLLGMAEDLNGTSTLSESLATILPKLTRLMEGAAVWVFRYDPQKRAFVELGASGLPSALECNDQLALKGGWCYCQEQFHKGQMTEAVNMITCSRLRDAVGDKAGFVHHASVPLHSNQRPLGILNVAIAGQSLFTNEALQLLTAIGNLLSVAMDRAAARQSETRFAQALRLITQNEQIWTLFSEELLLEQACRFLTQVLGYPSCAALDEKGDLVAKSIGEPEKPPLYVYPQAGEGVVLSTSRLLLGARSSLEVNIPHDRYRLYVEACSEAAFDAYDQEVMHLFAMQLRGALGIGRQHRAQVKEARWLERRKIAADLHDSVSQRLFSANLLLRSLENHVPCAPEK